MMDKMVDINSERGDTKTEVRTEKKQRKKKTS